MFGIKKKVERVRVALVQALRAKSMQIMLPHKDTRPEAIPKHDVTRAQVLLDVAEILTHLRVEDSPDDDKE